MRNDRLGGRLGAMLNARRIASDHGAGFSFTWSSHDDVSPELRHPEQLFSEDFLARHRETELGFGELQQQALAVEALPAGADRDWLIGQLGTRNLRCSEAMRVVRLPWENPEEVAERLAQALDSIEFNPVVARAMARIRDSLGPAALVAYHLRRGDIIDPTARPSNVLWPSKYIPRVFYEEHISRVLEREPQARIVIFSDAPHELRAFCALSARVIPAADLIADDGLQPLQRDFLELYSMSLCKRIVAPGASAFSSLAALLGNSRLIPITRDLAPEDRDRALTRLTRQLDQTPEVFAGDADLGQNFPELIGFHTARGTPQTARAILQKHHDRGFRPSYIHDLLAEQHFWAGDAEAALALADSLKDRPILTDLANAQVYAWAGLAALAQGRMAEATRMAHIAQWLQPNLPIARILAGGLAGRGSAPAAGTIAGITAGSGAEAVARADPARLYPVAPEFVLLKGSIVPRFNAIAQRLSGGKGSGTGSGTGSGSGSGMAGAGAGARALLAFIPFELDLRDWRDIQSPRLPAAFWNQPNLHKLIGFFRSSFRTRLDQPQVMSMLGQLHLLAQDPETGLPLIRQARAEDPRDPLVAIRHARLLWRQRRRAAALEGFAEAADLSGRHLAFLAEQGLALARAGQKDEAIALFTEIWSRGHDFVEIHIMTADVLRRKGATRDLALQVAAHVDAMVPGARRTAQIHQKVLEQLGRKDEARRIAERFVAWNRVCGRFSSRVGRPD